MTPFYALFETSLGPCALVWGPAGIRAACLPEATPAALVARIEDRHPGAAPGAVPPDIAHAVALLARLLTGEHVDLTPVQLDMAGIPAFHRRVYDDIRRIPPGATLTYGQVSQRLNAPGSARAVGQALAANPFLLIVPCHRVLATGGAMGGFSAHGGTDTKRRLLAIERGTDLIEPSLFDTLPLAPPPRQFRRKRRA
jgi:methylated-DNA-[protein]-cysteine S-methyltransferase